MKEILEILYVSGDLQIYFSEFWELAKKFHDSYEKNSAITGWNTQEKCQVCFDELPKKNLLTMILTLSELY